MQDLLTLSQTEFLLLAAICFCAGLVRGFTGFALSAIVMASAALILSPIALIPICWWLELVASAMMQYRSVCISHNVFLPKYHNPSHFA